MNIKNSNELLNVKPSAIWARVSTHQQSETSLPTQVDRCRALLESQGFTPTKILTVDWSSLDLYSCPEFQALRRLILNHEIAALAVYDRDRLEAKGLQRLIFLSECRDNDVRLLIVYGPPVIDGPESQIVELALAVGKERQVLRARQGSRDGLRDRAILRKKPVTYRPIFGYDWDKEKNSLVPNNDYSVVKRLFDILLSGAGYTTVVSEFKRDRILSPSGLPEWTKTTISHIVHNPVYAGRFYALKKTVVRSPKFKIEQIPESDWHYIPEITIEQHPITWEQRQLLNEQIQKHWLLSQRNAKKDYLLRGMVMCENHPGQNGEPRRFHGAPKRNTHYYVCSVDGHINIPGPLLERRVKEVIAHLFTSEKNESVWQSLALNTEKTKELLTAQLKRLSDELSRCFRSEANLEFRFSDNKIVEEVYDLAKSKQVVKRKSIEEQIRSLKAQSESISDSSDYITSVVELRKKFLTDIASFDNQQWRDILIMLDCRILVSEVKPAVMAGNVAYHEHGWLDFGIEMSKKYLQKREKIRHYFHIPVIGKGFTAILLLMMPKLIDTDGFKRIALRKPARVKSIRLCLPRAAGVPPVRCARIPVIHLKRALRGGSN